MRVVSVPLAKSLILLKFTLLKYQIVDNISLIENLFLKDKVIETLNNGEIVSISRWSC